MESNQLIVLLICLSVILILIFGDFSFKLNFKKEKTENESSNEMNPINSLSNSEYKVLGLVIDGLTNQQIADELHLSVATVKKHLSNIFKKLKISKRSEARKFKNHFEHKID